MDLFNRKLVVTLRRNLEISRDLVRSLEKAREDITESCDHRVREVDHMLGLERKRHEMEIEEAVRSAHWDASQKLEREKERHLEAMLATINRHHEEIISRLPTVHVDRQITQEKRTDSG